MRTIHFKNAILYKEKGAVLDPVIKVAGGEILGIENEIGSNQEVEVISFKDTVKIVPGFIDIHIHGVENADVMDGSKTSLEKMKAALPKEGTTSFLATTITQSIEAKRKALQQVNHVMNYSIIDGAEIVGVHLEGPFINRKKAGAQPAGFIRNPDMDTFLEFFVAAGNQIKLVTLAPEENGGLDLVKELIKREIVPSIGHSNASYSQTKEAIRAGVSHATHLCNGMTGLHHRDVGIPGAVLLHEEIVAELIVDGVHLAPEMVRLVYKNKGADGIILITDSMRAKGLGEGEYDLGGQLVTVKNNIATLQDGTLAGSILKMNEAVKNMIHFSGCSFEEAIQMATINPAKQLRIDDRKGSLSVGKDADFVILDEEFNVMQTYVKGKKLFDSCFTGGCNHENYQGK